ncbi:MAG: hypothetical protein P0107_03450 [Nitrosomonas sp.]|nr:hypothetical protein [Nitrosomonas sp.]
MADIVRIIKTGSFACPFTGTLSVALISQRVSLPMPVVYEVRAFWEVQQWTTAPAANGVYAIV